MKTAPLPLCLVFELALQVRSLASVSFLCNSGFDLFQTPLNKPFSRIHFPFRRPVFPQPWNSKHSIFPFFPPRDSDIAFWKTFIRVLLALPALLDQPRISLKYLSSSRVTHKLPKRSCPYSLHPPLEVPPLYERLSFPLFSSYASRPPYGPSFFGVQERICPCAPPSPF